MSKIAIIAAFHVARQANWQRVIDYRKDNKLDNAPAAQRNGSLTIEDAREAYLLGIVNGFDAAIHALKDTKTVDNAAMLATCLQTWSNRYSY